MLPRRNVKLSVIYNLLLVLSVVFVIGEAGEDEDLPIGSGPSEAFKRELAECYRKMIEWGEALNAMIGAIECCVSIKANDCVKQRCQVVAEIKGSLLCQDVDNFAKVNGSCKKTYSIEKCDKFRRPILWIIITAVIIVVILFLSILIYIVFNRKFGKKDKKQNTQVKFSAQPNLMSTVVEPASKNGSGIASSAISSGVSSTASSAAPLPLAASSTASSAASSTASSAASSTVSKKPKTPPKKAIKREQASKGSLRNYQKDGPKRLSTSLGKNKAYTRSSLQRAVKF